MGGCRVLRRQQNNRMASIKSAYRTLLKSGELKPDPAQQAAVDALCDLQTTLQNRGFLGLFSQNDSAGLYLWGPPGRGKSMMMDLFFDNVRVEPKQRVHFHAFMSQVHHLIRKWREGDA